MPELPEVETVVRDLSRRVRGRKILDVWTDWPKYFRGMSLAVFRRHVQGKKILEVRRRGKNILIKLSGSYMVLVHLKMTGHLLLGRWEKRGGKWAPTQKTGPMVDPKNGFIRLIFFLDGPKNRSMLALSDLRRFAKVLGGPEKEILESDDLKVLGPEALEISYKEFKKSFETKRGKIKQVLLDQSFVAGVGNIYSDEILYDSKIHPLSRAEKLREAEIKKLFNSMKKILRRGVARRGTSTDDFRDTHGKKGGYGSVILVYQRQGKKCKRGSFGSVQDKHIIQRIKVAQRSAHFCPECQKLIQ